MLNLPIYLFILSGLPFNSKIFTYAVFNSIDGTIVGDLNSDEAINVNDILILVNNILSNEYELLGDINSDGINNINDILKIIQFILSNFND